VIARGGIPITETSGPPEYVMPPSRTAYSDPSYSDPSYSDPNYSDPSYSDPNYSDPDRLPIGC
jgi:hypothetical protein